MLESIITGMQKHITLLEVKKSLKKSPKQGDLQNVVPFKVCKMEKEESIKNVENATFANVKAQAQVIPLPLP
jgi:hypothetical protein